MYQRICILICLQIGYQQMTSQNIYTLPAAIDYALQHNYDHKKSQLEKMISYEKTQEVFTQGLPKITGSVGYQNQFIVPTSVLPGTFLNPPVEGFIPVQFGVSNSMNATVGLQQLLFDGRYLVGLQARRSIKELADMQVKMSERDVRVLITKSYYQAIVAQKSVKSLIEGKAVLDNVLSQTIKTYKQGLIEELDVERLQYNVKSLENTIAQMETRAKLANYALKLNMGYPMEQELNIVDGNDSIINMILTQTIQTSPVKNRIELLMSEQAIKLQQFDLKQTKSGYLPSIFGSAAFGYNSFSQQFNFWNVPWYSLGNFGIQAQIPIYDGGTRKSQIKQMTLNVQKAENDRLQMIDGIQLNIKNSILTLTNHINEYKNQKDILKLAEKIEKKTQFKYKEGVGSSFEFSNAQNERIQQYLNFLQNELNLINAQVEYQKAISNL